MTTLSITRCRCPVNVPHAIVALDNACALVSFR